MTSVVPLCPQAHSVASSTTKDKRRSTIHGRLASLLTGQSKRQYTTEKLLAFERYRHETPWWRVALVVIGTPLPSLLALLVPPLLPLRDPALGILQNPGFCVHFVLVMGCTVFGATIQGRAVTSLSHADFTTFEIIAMSLLSSTLLLGFTIGLATAWRFPIPFTWALDFVPWVFCLIWANILVLGRRLFSGVLKRPALQFFPSFFVQITQILIYPAFFAAFSAVNWIGQVLLTLCFPVIKYYLKKVLRLVSRGLDDYNEEVAVSGVEIAAAMYQSQIMQNTPSPVATAIIIGVDVLQGIASVRLFMDKTHPTVPRQEIVAKGIELVQSTGDKKGSKETADALVVQQAMEILHSAESILLVEYFEVAIPVVNGIYLAVAAQMDSARYNPNVREFYRHPDRLGDAMASLALYAMLQGLSVVAMNLVMAYRFRISAIAHVAFVLERHQWSVQGKLFSWLAVFFNFTVIHYGSIFRYRKAVNNPDTVIRLLRTDIDTSSRCIDSSDASDGGVRSRSGSSVGELRKGTRSLHILNQHACESHTRVSQVDAAISFAADECEVKHDSP